ncbi:hypothetical protein EX895_001480 [Sporisorium graminicola]|uniref:DUF300-domain-containing protein n=1 Tax=Sporisorium graminicola TaxID=280036 RepID=A0A4U7KXX5_9BASI|nr:hypothetical protein EX895_001480 [Sporisorium graminicola]TKY89695.1 hypothetical protein EX895_001480 [Sporisorium graminicola]
MVNMTCPTIPDKPTDPKPFFANGQIDFKAHDVGWLICGIMALIATISSSWLIWKHLTYYTCPQQQRHIVRLLIMVPIYAIVSFMSYLFYEQALYYQTIRDCYEAVLVTSFFYLILAYTGDTRAEQHAVFRNLDVGDRFWVWPLGRWKYRPEGLHFLWLMKICVLQYAIIRPLCTFIAVGTEYFGYYCLHSWMPWFTHVWCALLISISVTVAMYCLIQLYMPVRKLVDPYKPVLKFLSIKTIVFLTFWQDTLLSFLVSFGAIKETDYFTAEQIQAGINALLQCFWMLLFGFIHIKAFSYLPYRPEDRARTTKRGKALLDSLDFRDWFYEMKESTRYVAARSKGRNYTLAEDLRAKRHEHLLNAFGKHRTANLETEIDVEKATMPTFWKNPEDAQFWTPGDDSKHTASYVKTHTADDSMPSQGRPSAARDGGRLVEHPREAHAQRAAELQRLVAELDLQEVDQSIVGVQDHEYGYDDERYERAALIHQHHEPTSRAFHHLDSPGKDDDKHPELTQYHAATVQLANIPSLTYDQAETPHAADAVQEEDAAAPAAHARQSSRTAPGVGAFGIASWFGWNSSTDPHETQQQRTGNSAANGYLQPGETYGADAQLRSPDAEGTNWWRNYWDRVSHAGSREPSVAGIEDDEKETAAPPAVMRQVTAGSWGIENIIQQAQQQQSRFERQAAGESMSGPLAAPPALRIETRGKHAGHMSLDSTASPSSIISPHTDSPLSRLIQTSRDSFSSLNRDEVREQLAASSSNLSPRKADAAATTTTANPTIRAVTATSRPTVAPRASSFAAASSKQASVSRVTSTTTRSGTAAEAAAAMPLASADMSSTTTGSTAKHPIVFADALVEQPVAEDDPVATEVAAKPLPPAVGPKGKLFNLVLPSPLSPARYPYGKEGEAAPEENKSGSSKHQPQRQNSEANDGAGTLKWVNQSKPQKFSATEASSVDAAAVKLPKGKNVITVGGMSLAQAKAAQEKADTQAHAQQQQEQSRTRSTAAPVSAPKSILLEGTTAKREGKLVLPAPSRFTGAGEDPYLAGRSAVVDRRPPAANRQASGGLKSATSVVTSSAQTKMSSATTFEVGSIVPRQAVRASMSPSTTAPPLSGYYESLRRSHVDVGGSNGSGAQQQQQQRHSYVPSVHGPPMLPPHPGLHLQQQPRATYSPSHAPPQAAQFAPASHLGRPVHAPALHRQYPEAQQPSYPNPQHQPNRVQQTSRQFQFEYYQD